MKKKLNEFKRQVQEDAPTNCVGNGSAVAGIGVGPNGEPGVKKKKIPGFISYMKRGVK